DSGASGTATGEGNVDLSVGLSLGDSCTDYPVDTAKWGFDGRTHYYSRGVCVAIPINKADAVVSVSGYEGTYDALAHGATGTATGIGRAAITARRRLGAADGDYAEGTGQ